MLIPSNGATVSGSTLLDASASNATSVEFQLFGGIYGFYGPVALHGHADLLRMVVQLEHHDGPQRFLRCVVFGVQLDRQRLQQGGVNITVGN